MHDERRTPDVARRRERTRLAAGLVFGGLVTAFALLNTGDVKVNWIFGTASTPLIVVIVVSMLIGVILDRIVRTVRRRRRPRRP